MKKKVIKATMILNEDLKPMTTPLPSEPYNRRDHSHCFESENPPCGLKGKHRCCLCEKEVPTSEEWEKEFDEKFKGFQPDDGTGRGAIDAEIYEVKSFITSLLTSEREKAREEERERNVTLIKSFIGKWSKAHRFVDEKTNSLVNDIYDKAVLDILSFLKDTNDHQNG